MEFNKLAPWNWFRHEQESGTYPESLRGFDLNPFDKMRTDFNKMMSDSTRLDSSFPSLSDFKPSIDVKDAGTEYKINVEVPGVDKEDLKIQVNDGLLFISGEKRHEAKEENDNFYRVESSFGSFSRTLNLPTDADEERVDANFRNGVLTLNIAKHEQEQHRGPRQIDIR